MNKIISAALVSLVSLASTQAQAQSASCTSRSSGSCETGYVEPLNAGSFLYVEAGATGAMGRSLGAKVEIINCSNIVINTKTVGVGETYYANPTGDPGVRARVTASGFGSLFAKSANLKITKLFN